MAKMEMEEGGRERVGKRERANGEKSTLREGVCVCCNSLLFPAPYDQSHTHTHTHTLCCAMYTYIIHFCI